MRILFISHDATRTGAPIVLLHFLEWMKENSDSTVDILLLKGGDLQKRFEAAGNTVMLSEDSLFKRGVRKIFKSTGPMESRIRKVFKQLPSREYDLIYANTIVSMKPALMLADLFMKRPKVIGHMHELKIVINQFAPDFSEYAGKIDRYVAASELVKKNLTTLIDPDKVDVVYECSRIHHKPEEAQQGVHKLIVGGSGTVHWRKGHDVFIQVAKYMKQYLPNVEVSFVWVGRLARLDKLIVEEDLRKAGLETTVTFTGETDTPDRYFQTFDLFMMSSREDPFPLVCVEVGQFGVPILCFKGATGTEEVLTNGGGRVIDYLDIRGMAEAIAEYAYDSDLLNREKSKAAEVFSRFVPEKVCPGLLKVIEKAKIP